MIEKEETDLRGGSVSHESSTRVERGGKRENAKKKKQPRAAAIASRSSIIDSFILWLWYCIQHALLTFDCILCCVPIEH